MPIVISLSLCKFFLFQRPRWMKVVPRVPYYFPFCYRGCSSTHYVSVSTGTRRFRFRSISERSRQPRYLTYRFQHSCPSLRSNTFTIRSLSAFSPKVCLVSGATFHEILFIVAASVVTRSRLIFF